MRRIALIVLALGAAVLLAPAASTGDGWQALRRPLHLPALSAGGKCPASPAAPSAGFEDAIGPGPVYPVLGPILMAVYEREWGRPWAGRKVFWFVHQRYEGPVLIRGRRLGGWEWMRFDDGRKPAAELRLEPGETVIWNDQPPGSRGRPSFVRVRAPGCYAAQIDGTSFSRVVVFPVDVVR